MGQRNLVCCDPELHVSPHHYRFWSEGCDLRNAESGDIVKFRVWDSEGEGSSDSDSDSN
jgi:hypothetical protein